MWIKICGMTDAAAVAAAMSAAVDAVGFVFAPSVRRLRPEQAAALALPARGKLRLVAVTRHPDQTLLDQIIGTLRPDVLQTDIEDFEGLRLPQALERLPVVRAVVREVAGRDTLPPRLLFEGPQSGSGHTSDWQQAAQCARRTQLILAGGLNCGNVAAAIAAVRPYGVDVSSGVEYEPGRKSPEKIAEFVRVTRATRIGDAA